MKTMVLAITALMALAYAACGDGIAGDENAYGVGAGNESVTGGNNTAYGDQAVYSLTSGSANTALGDSALYSLTSGSDNTALGDSALLENTTGAQNIAIGSSTLKNNTTGYGNIALGYWAGSGPTNGDNNIDIGNPGEFSDSATIRIGAQGTHTNTFIAGISGVTVSGGSLVVVNSNGQLGTAPAGSAVPQGAVITLPTGTAAPSGYTRIGTTEMKIKYEVGDKSKNKTLTLDVYQLQ